MDLKRLAEISPIIVGFLIFLGYLKLSLYYIHWDINIANYLDFSEILLSFLNDLNTISFFILILILQMSVGVIAINSVSKRTIDKLNIYSSDDLSKSNFEGILPYVEKFIEERHNLFIGMLVILTIIPLFLFLCFFKLIFLYITFFISIQLFIVIIDKLIGIRDEKVQLQLSAILSLFCFTYCLTLYDIDKTERKSQKVILTTIQNESIYSGDNLIFIGKTNNFHFFYDKTKDESIVIKDSEVIKSQLINYAD